MANSLQEEHIPLQDLGGATGQDDGDDTLTPLIHSAPEEQAAEAKTVEKKIPFKKRKAKSPPK